MAMPTLTEIDDLLKTISEDYLTQVFPYCPYSNYPVWAAVWAESDGMNWLYYGANYEEIAFNATIHGEQAAIVGALNSLAPADNHKIINGVWVRTRNGGTPCGHCRQFIAEFASSPDIPIVTEDFEGERKFYTLRDLLPNSFDSLE